MKKKSLFTVSLLSAFISLSCYAYQDVVLHDDSLSDAQVSVNDRTGKTQVEVISTNQDKISHIYYDRFDVGEDGLLLKNNKAELIINEVVSKDFSILRGELELQGKKATVVIANPNGIFCRDCSFSGANNIKLITGSSTGKFSKQFTLTDANIGFYFFNELPRNNFMSMNRVYKDISSEKINIISNNVSLNRGHLNAKYIRFDIGLSKFNLGSKSNYNKEGNLYIEKDGVINSRYLTIKGRNASIKNYGYIDTLSLNVEAKSLDNMGVIEVNTDTNLYKTYYDNVKKSKIVVSKNYKGYQTSSFYIQDSLLFVKAKNVMLDKKFTINGSYVAGDANNLVVKSVELNKSYFKFNAKNNIHVYYKIHGEGSVEFDSEGFINRDKLELTGKGKGELKGIVKFDLGKEYITAYTELN